jgi:phage tail sheath protein FI
MATHNDLDHGRLICLIGFAPAKPAEFVIFRIARGIGETRRLTKPFERNRANGSWT